MNKTTKYIRNFIYEYVGVIMLYVISILLMFVYKPAALITLAAGIVCTLVVFVLHKTGKRYFHRNLDSIGMSHLVASLVEDIDSPIMIVTENNKIIWSNDEFGSLPEVSQHHLTSGASRLFDGKMSYSNLESAFDTYIDYIPIETENSYYEVKIFPIKSASQKMFGTVWYSRDVQKRLKQELLDNKVRIAYIVVDNTNEITEEVQENRRFASAAVNNVLVQWANSYNATLTEYDTDKYVMQFENKHIKDMMNSRFDILDKVVDASLGESIVPITISIGVSSIEGTLVEKRESAQASLRVALQRGGAIAVVRNGDEEYYFGGKTKAVQRQTKIRSRLCRDLLCNQLESCSNVIIMGHKWPDFDSIASNIGISKLVQAYKKKFYIVADLEDENVSKIVNTISHFPEYENVFVDPSFAQKQIQKDTLVIITDATNPDIFPSVPIYEAANRVVVIDHHAIVKPLGPQVFKQSNIDPSASSASELVCEILELSSPLVSLRTEEAQVLMTGILLDTQFFSRDTGTRTYSACMFLKSAGADAGKAKQFFKSNVEQYAAITDIERSMYVFRDKFTIACSRAESAPENKILASKAADRLVEVEGVMASFVLYLLGGNVCVSARSDGTFNVINVCGVWGGGGHFQSAGATIKNESGVAVTDIDEAIKLLENAIDSYLKESSKEGKTV